MQSFIALVACLDVASAGAFPGQFLRGLPRVQLSSRVHDLSAHAHALPKHLSLPDTLRNAVMCCKDMTAECIACATNQDLSQFCIEHTRMPGCESILDKVKENSRAQGLDGVLNRAVETVVERVGGVKAEELVDEYLEKNPTVARTSLANLTSKGFDTVSHMKKSLKHRSDHHVAAEVRKSWGRPFTERGQPKELVSETSFHDDNDDEAATDEFPNELFSFTNPWVIAVCALVVTAVTTGIAVGALCHARIQNRAREPLLSTLLQTVDSRAASGNVP